MVWVRVLRVGNGSIFCSGLRGVVGTIIRMRVLVPPECPALRCKGQSLCAGLVDGFLVVGGLVVAVAAAGFIIVMVD